MARPRFWTVLAVSLCLVAQFTVASFLDLSVDSRALQTGTMIVEDKYLDQPYCVIYSPTGRWVCGITRNSASEGNRGEHVEVFVSDDHGATWSTGLRVEAASAATNAYSTILLTNFNRIYLIYNMNTDNVTKFPDGKPLARDDELGHFVMRWSDDGGATFSKERIEVPYRKTAIDFNNTFKGVDKIMWSVDQVKDRYGITYHAFTKIGTYPQNPPEELWFLSSPNILHETNASAVQWALLPDGDHGIQPPAIMNWEEAHIVPMQLNPGFFALCRTSMGFLGASWTNDPAGAGGWLNPGTAALYSEALAVSAKRALKNPQGPITIKVFANGLYLLLYYFVSYHGYSARNPYWLSAGREEGEQIRFTQPEIALYNTQDQANDRPGYPDFVEDGGSIFITETNKTIARVHRIDPALLNALWSQFESKIVPGNHSLVFTATSQHHSFATPALPDPSAASYSPRAGTTIALWVTGHPSTAGETIVDVGTLKLATTTMGAVHLQVSDRSGRGGNLTMDSWCTAVLADHTKPHLLAAVLDAGAHVVMLSVDGAVCDGSSESPLGWQWIANTTASLAAGAQPTFTLGATYTGTIVKGWWWPRALFNSEIVATARAGF